MALDPLYITTSDLESYFVDKTTGEPLAGGFVYFWEDTARTVPKLVYELSDEPPYALADSYSPLPNPIQLSMVGTPQDAAGNNITVYYYPYDAAGNLQLYFIQVFDQFGIEQFTREAWPNQAIENTNPDGFGASGAISNLLTNPQFSQVLFVPTAAFVIPIAEAGAYSFRIAPGWFINITAAGAGNVTILRNSITGITAYPYNPPYTLTVTPGANITGLTLTQRLFNNPDVWSPQNAASLNGYVAASILLAPASSVTMSYTPSTGAPQVILTANNLLGVYSEFNNTVQLAPATNTDNSNVGYVDVVLTLSTVNVTTFSNLQVVSLNSNITGVAFYQAPVNRQLDQMFNYYNRLLQYKQIPSHLIGWDFHLNPAQFLGTTVGPLALGVNTSFYAWDQTIIYQSATSGIVVSRSAAGNGALRITANANTQFAIIQYLPQSDARKILNDRISVNIAALQQNPVVGAGTAMTASLWYTTGALPSTVGANNSIVLTLDANGKPATFNGTWFEVPRLLPTALASSSNATFTIPAAPPPDVNNFYDFGFSGWDMQGIAAVNTATFFAIVIGSAPVLAAVAIDFDSISTVSGDIPTRPSPTNGGETLRKCEMFYQKSFNTSQIPQAGIGHYTGEWIFTLSQDGGVPGAIDNTYVPFRVPFISTPNILILNPVHLTNQIYNESSTSDFTGTLTFNVTQKGMGVGGTPDVGALQNQIAGFHWTADSRLGL